MVECLSFEGCLSWSPDQHFLSHQSLTYPLDVMLFQKLLIGDCWSGDQQ